MSSINKIEAQKRKSSILLEMGIILYEKIRNNEIDDEIFLQLSKDILNLDKIIYDETIEIEEFENQEKGILCECGNISSKNDKFCAECGTNLKKEDNKEFKVCRFCETKIDLDSKYCACCGHKLF